MSFALIGLLGAYFLFTALQSTAELAGPEFSLGGGVAGFVVIFYLLFHSFDHIAQGYPVVPPLEEEKQESILEDSVKKVEKDPKKVREILESIGEAYVTIDTSSLPGGSGVSWRVPYEQFDTAQKFLNAVWAALPPGLVRPYTYGKDWVLVDAASGKEFNDLGRRGGKKDDNRSLKEAGITPGMRLLVSTPGFETYEDRVYKLVNLFDGQTVPGRVFNIKGNFRLPAKFISVSRSKKFEFLPDSFDIYGEGPPEDWIVEVKAGRAVPTRVIKRLRTAAEAIEARVWLVVFSTPPAELVERCRSLRILISGREEFEELESLVTPRH
jgi:hypothetical protein